MFATLIGSSLLLLGAVIVTVIVESQAAYRLEFLGGPGPQRALVLFHPSREAGFSDDLSAALAEGLKEAGHSVDRATLTRDTPATPNDYVLICVVSNTYWWTPDLPTLRFLARARLSGIATVGLIGGAGATSRAQRLLEEALRVSGARVLPTRAFWLWRPNDEHRMAEANRAVAIDLPRQLGRGVRSLDTSESTPRSRP